MFCSALIKAHVQVCFGGVFSENDHLSCFASLVAEGSADVTEPTILPPIRAGTCLREESVLFKLA